VPALRQRNTRKGSTPPGAPGAPIQEVARGLLRLCGRRGVTPTRPMLMTRLSTLPLVLAAIALSVPEGASGHGGVYRGPGSSVPPGGGSGGGAGDRVPPSGGGSGPTAPRRSTGGTGAPGGNRPSNGGPKAVGGGSQTKPDATTWELWWGFNKEPFLNLKAAIHTGTLVAGSDDFFLGRRPADIASDRLRPTEETVRETIVPALLAALSTENHKEIVTGALIALAKIGDGEGPSDHPPLAPVIARFLTDSNQEISETAAVALGILGNETSIPTLRELLFDTPRGRELVGRAHEVPWRTRAFAAYGLGLIGHRIERRDVRRSIVGDLVRAFDEGSRMATPDLSIGCLAALGLVPLPNERDWQAREDDRRVRDLATQIEWVLDRTGERTNHLIRSQAPTVLARLTRHAPDDQELRARVVERLIAALSSDLEREVRQSALLALGAIGDADDDPVDERIRDVLMRASLKSSDPQMTNFALVALAKAGARPGDGGTPSAGTADVRAHLLGMMEHGPSSARPWTGLALGVLGRDRSDRGLAIDAEVDVELRRELRDARSPADIGAFAIASGLRADVEARAILREKLAETSDATARGYVAVALGLADARESIGAIQDVVRSSKYQPALLRQAAISLGLLGDKDVVPDLVAMLENARSLSASAALASALGIIGDARSVDPLVRMLADRELTGGARGFAAVALGIVADKESLPWNVKLSVGTNYRANVETLTNAAGTGILDIL